MLKTLNFCFVFQGMEHASLDRNQNVAVEAGSVLRTGFTFNHVVCNVISQVRFPLLINLCDNLI